MKIEIDGEEYIAREPTGYELLKFTEKYLDMDGNTKEGISTADMIVELVGMIFGVPEEDVKKLPWGALQQLNEAANNYLTQVFAGETEKK
ncbi:MAG: phage tail assembly protein [Bacillaceae bacterium]|nr:phage tail assembly protein [Bacillaceae bacterium]